MSTYTSTETSSFTITHARYIASKVATDLKRFQRFYYGLPNDDLIDRYEGELAGLLKHNAVDIVVYGFQRNSLWTPASVRYRAIPGGSLLADDDPGKIRPGIDVSGARFTSFLSYSNSWWDLTQAERDTIRKGLPINRSTGSSPDLETGAWSDDLSYSAGGRGLGRSSVRT
jgi:Bacterial HORMA domain family 1